MRGASLSLPTSATAQFRRFFDCGRALRCLLPVASGRFLHLVVLYGYQGADGDAERLSLTDQLFDAALGNFGLLLWISLVLLLEISTWSPPKSLACLKGFRLGSGLILNLLGLLLLVCLLLSLVSVLGVLLVVIVWILWLVALLLRLRLVPVLFSRIGGLFLIMLLGLLFFIPGGLVGFLSPYGVRPFGLLLGCRLWKK